ncbi:hypothetical protein ABL78_6843 [Leptomonas seymouri]|uniref:Gamma-butyrobetaine hydroxylase-like N-terminal domain-containing protein n=1 Tax=Leptomonas seymouri TaxID=5684 RepID=A0A0N0P3G8_LEPSE|nr:hypothetical protein ABL78_6843 [Leptomonas seymouri]|eukprot:KPI84106.1 hypothetical protein ABL78_6843 [Leptomonas seymouri]
MPFLRRLQGLSLRCQPLAASAAAADTSANTRPYSSLIRKLSESVSARVSQLSEDVWLADEKLVTESRRKIVPQHALTQSLAERLAKQRNVRQHLVPLSVKVDKSRQYVEFTWPAEAVELMRGFSTEEQSLPPPEVTFNNSDQVTSTSTSSRAGTAASFSLPSFVAPALAPAAVEVESSGERAMPLRTRALAEYLRAYTPSTDGALGAKDIIIYGRRGLCISQIVPMGNYALRFVFSDDHSGGIYSYEYLFYLTGPATKYGLMRAYIKDLKRRRKSRDPPKRAPSKRYAREDQRADNR